MKKKEEKKYKYTKESAKGSIGEGPEPPIDKPDPTEPVKVIGTKEGKEHTLMCNSYSVNLPRSIAA